MNGGVFNDIEKLEAETPAISDRADFCVGYFNLCGWKQIDESLTNLASSGVPAKVVSFSRLCQRRLHGSAWS